MSLTTLFTRQRGGRGAYGAMAMSWQQRGRAGVRRHHARRAVIKYFRRRGACSLLGISARRLPTRVRVSVS